MRPPPSVTATLATGGGAHGGHRSTAPTGQQGTASASELPGRWLFATVRRRSGGCPFGAPKATVRPSGVHPGGPGGREGDGECRRDWPPVTPGKQSRTEPTEGRRGMILSVPSAWATSAIGWPARPGPVPCGGTLADTRVVPCCAPIVGQHRIQQHDSTKPGEDHVSRQAREDSKGRPPQPSRRAPSRPPGLWGRQVHQNFQTSWGSPPVWGRTSRPWLVGRSKATTPAIDWPACKLVMSSRWVPSGAR
jgi:hypothetical protein